MTTMLTFTKPALCALVLRQMVGVAPTARVVSIDQPQSFHDLLAGFLKRLI